ncbi:hypothetical protein BDD12DRAFT_730789 [Trichophaea hybrida]|nr:hypothetical protein BDD12DRAFT_730789 [Trichophaea hybrida]
MLILFTCFPGIDALDRQTSVVNNVALYSSTRVSVFPTLPTLIYNCNELQAICQNVEQYITTNGLGNLGNGWDFHYQRSTTNSATRGRQVCPGNWNKMRVPSCGTQPGQPDVNPGGLSPAVMTHPPGIFQAEIPDLAGNPSGMSFTCDEFPARSWIEGGTGPGGLTTTTYCAPKRVSCSGKLWKLVKAQNPGYPDVASEQDWQGSAHKFIGDYAAARSALVMKFHFTTTRIGVNNPRTAAQVILPAYATVAATTKISGRDVAPPVAGNFFNIMNANCTGEFCAALEEIFFTAGYDMKAQPTPVVPSCDHIIARDGPQHTGVAVIDILV